ncbi:ice-binding family protein [Flavobacterium sp. RSB2_4_14]|uniref:ice-binding family protein n=1 Tax=Flavobacterium sp. RSB2_4_14 TaxID=3447665 RepID=UPI003F2F99A2
MKKNLLNRIIVVSLFFIQNVIFGQAPNLGTAANFELFTSVGAVRNTGTSLITGNVGTNSGSSTGFGNVNGVMHDGNGTSAQCGTDLLAAYGELNSAIPNYFPAPLLGNGQILPPGIYSISSVASLNLDLTLDAQNNANAVWIFQIGGAFASSANAEVKLINGALACNVFWKIEGLVSLATNTKMKGTIVANNAAIIMSTGVSLEGRALSTSGSIDVDGVLSYTPIGCGSPVLNGPTPPPLNSTECYAIFSSNGYVTNAGVSTITGDVGTNVGLTTGFNALNVNGNIHPIPDTSTAQAATDLTGVYNFLNLLPFEIELLYPAQFGNNLVLTPHTYLLNAATVLTGNLYLNAQNNPNAVFVIKINGALSTSTYANVILMNGAQAKNVFWKVSGAVIISDFSEFKGTLVANNGAVDLTTGVILEGRAFTTNGALSTAAINATMPMGCSTMGTVTLNDTQKVIIYPNPFDTLINVKISDTFDSNNTKMILYDIYGREVLKANLTNTTTIDMSGLSSTIYFYKIISNDTVIQSGKLISK